jgi:amphi-Trp domain-containing protein
MSDVEFGHTEPLIREDAATLLTTLAEAVAGFEGTVHGHVGDSRVSLEVPGRVSTEVEVDRDEVEHEIEFAPAPGRTPGRRHGVSAVLAVVSSQDDRLVHDPVDAQFARLEACLLTEAGSDPGRQEAVRSCLATAHARFAGATVRTYLPVLVERRARELLRSVLSTGST